MANITEEKVFFSFSFFPLLNIEGPDARNEKFWPDKDCGFAVLRLAAQSRP